jgi:hypothetical protein
MSRPTTDLKDYELSLRRTLVPVIVGLVSGAGCPCEHDASCGACAGCRGGRVHHGLLRAGPCGRTVRPRGRGPVGRVHSASVHGRRVNIVGRAEWGAKPAVGVTNLVPSRVRLCVLHHTTGTYAGAQTVRNIQAFHQGPTRKWADIAYSFLVAPDGTIYEGRGWGKQGAHAKGYNSSSVGIAYIGDGRTSRLWRRWRLSHGWVTRLTEGLGRCGGWGIGMWGLRCAPVMLSTAGGWVGLP